MYKDRATQKDWDFKDDCTEFILSVLLMFMTPCNCKIVTSKFNLTMASSYFKSFLVVFAVSSFKGYLVCVLVCYPLNVKQTGVSG